MAKCAIRAYKVCSNRTSLAFHTENKRPMWRVHRYGIALQPAGLEAFYVIINLPHHISETRPRMPAYDRAAQFSPFAALTGYEAAVAETGRLTDKKVELDEGEKEAINERLNLILERIDERPQISITYFVPDKKKTGGEYIVTGGIVKKIDDYRRLVILWDGTSIPIDEIIRIEGRLFQPLDAY